jgi:hypothetical protein
MIDWDRQVTETETLGSWLDSAIRDAEYATERLRISRAFPENSGRTLDDAEKVLGSTQSRLLRLRAAIETDHRWQPDDAEFDPTVDRPYVVQVWGGWLTPARGTFATATETLEFVVKSMRLQKYWLRRRTSPGEILVREQVTAALVDVETGEHAKERVSEVLAKYELRIQRLELPANDERSTEVKVELAHWRECGPVVAGEAETRG